MNSYLGPREYKARDVTINFNDFNLFVTTKHLSFYLSNIIMIAAVHTKIFWRIF